MTGNEISPKRKKTQALKITKNCFGENVKLDKQVHAAETFHSMMEHNWNKKVEPISHGDRRTTDNMID